MQVKRVIGCARCGGDHQDVKVFKLDRPHAPPEAKGVVWNFWAPCPTNEQPIMFVIPDDGTEDREASMPPRS